VPKLTSLEETMNEIQADVRLKVMDYVEISLSRTKNLMMQNFQKF
jgi:hypothetical protein